MACVIRMLKNMQMRWQGHFNGMVRTGFDRIDPGDAQGRDGLLGLGSIFSRCNMAGLDLQRFATWYACRAFVHLHRLHILHNVHSMHMAHIKAGKVSLLNPIHCLGTYTVYYRV